MKKLYEALSVDVVKFEAQDVITTSIGTPIEEVPADKENIGQQPGTGTDDGTGGIGDR